MLSSWQTGGFCCMSPTPSHHSISHTLPLVFPPTTRIGPPLRSASPVPTQSSPPVSHLSWDDTCARMVMKVVTEYCQRRLCPPESSAMIPNSTRNYKSKRTTSTHFIMPHAPGASSHASTASSNPPIHPAQIRNSYRVVGGSEPKSMGALSLIAAASLAFPLLGPQISPKTWILLGSIGANKWVSASGANDAIEDSPSGPVYLEETLMPQWCSL
ncbi:hypothetical protein D9613_008833 [Agrocybe pediades]|uniref:Uncharacterized protein n=1 Tax=Agrocybe pediades TaxID=84607 RepID=A0A8H4QTL8_9AGAR|nr:hypothetical protein D9613_008833 [Agrocybe pediades]